jgi:hypothetical protein
MGKNESVFCALAKKLNKKFVCWQKKLKTKRWVGGQSVCNCVQNCSFHVCSFNVSTVVIGFPVTQGYQSRFKVAISFSFIDTGLRAWRQGPCRCPLLQVAFKSGVSYSCRHTEHGQTSAPFMKRVKHKLVSLMPCFVKYPAPLEEILNSGYKMIAQKNLILVGTFAV